MNPLKPEGPEEEKLFQEGEGVTPPHVTSGGDNSKRLCVNFVSFVLPANKVRRVELSTASLLKVAPTDEERKIVHDLFLNTLDTKYEVLHCDDIITSYCWRRGMFGPSEHKVV